MPKPDYGMLGAELDTKAYLNINEVEPLFFRALLLEEVAEKAREVCRYAGDYEFLKCLDEALAKLD